MRTEFSEFLQANMPAKPNKGRDNARFLLSKL